MTQRTPNAQSMPEAVALLLDRAIPLGALSSSQVWAMTVKHGFDFENIVLDIKALFLLTVTQGTPFHYALCELVDEALAECRALIPPQKRVTRDTYGGGTSTFSVATALYDHVKKMLEDQMTPRDYSPGLEYHNVIPTIKYLRYNEPGLGLGDAKYVVDVIIGRC